MPHDAPNVSRREVLKTTLLFSSGLLAGGFGSSLEAAQGPRTRFSGGLDVLAFGDFGTNNEKQRKVADAMNDFAGSLGQPLSAVLALGDNFYGKLTPETFGPRFDGFYPTRHLDCPFQALLGNHDYGPSYDSGQGRAKADMQLDYAARRPKSRWKMPGKWHAFELGAEGDPLVKVIYLDGNFFEGALTPEEKIAQRRWLAAEIAKPLRARWLWIASHYPVFSDTAKDRSAQRERLLKEWGPLFRDKRVSLYLSGHDHNLQHLRVQGMRPDFIVSGGGGASRYEVKSSPRGFSMKTRGFNHIHVTRDLLTVQFINPEGQLIHAFERRQDGSMRILPV